MQTSFTGARQRRHNVAAMKRTAPSIPLYDVSNGQNHTYPVVISIPHSGTYIPPAVRRQLNRPLTLANVDWHLPKLYSFLKEMGVTVITSNISRYVVDLSRDASSGAGEDPQRAAVYEKTTFGRAMYSSALPVEEVERRIEAYHRPYHNCLTTLIEAKQAAHGEVYLIDMHSFFKPLTPEATPDILLSNDNPATAKKSVFDCLTAQLEAQGYSVGDHPIQENYILQHYKELFGEQLHCLQLDLRYTHYLQQRHFDEEEVYEWDDALFRSAQRKLNAALYNTFAILKQTSLA